MGFLSVFTHSSIITMIVAFIFVIFAVRCLLYGIMGGTSTILRIIGAVVFAAVAYYLWRHSQGLSGANAIDNFVYGSLTDLKGLFSSLF